LTLINHTADGYHIYDRSFKKYDILFWDKINVEQQKQKYVCNVKLNNNIQNYKILLYDIKMWKHLQLNIIISRYIECVLILIFFKRIVYYFFSAQAQKQQISFYEIIEINFLLRIVFMIKIYSLKII